MVLWRSASVSTSLGPGVRDVVLARLISSTGAGAAFFLGLWGKAAFVFDGTPDLAIMSALVGLAAMLGSVIGGVAVDRFDGRRVVIASEEAVFVPATLALVFATDMPRLMLFGIVSWLAGAALETAIVSLPRCSPRPVASSRRTPGSSRPTGSP